MRIWSHLIWAGFIVSVVAALLIAVAQTDQPAGQCSGLGWGCTLSGADLAAFAAMLVVPIALVVMAIGHVLVAFVQSLRKRR